MWELASRERHRQQLLENQASWVGVGMGMGIRHLLPRLLLLRLLVCLVLHLLLCLLLHLVLRLLLRVLLHVPLRHPHRLSLKGP